MSLQSQIDAMRAKAETGEQWAAVCRMAKAAEDIESGRFRLNIFEVTGAGLVPMAVQVEPSELGDGWESIIEAVAGAGYARVGGGAATLFHVEQSSPTDMDIESVPVRFDARNA